MNKLNEKTKISFINYFQMDNWSIRYLKSHNFNYDEKYKLYKIGDFLTRNKEIIEIEDEKEYKRVTIKLYNKGVYIRDKEFGKNIGVKRQYKVKEGQFILSKIDARNGAFGIVPQELEGAITTADFLSYEIDTSKINPEFLSLLTTTKEFLKYCQNSSSGTTGRQRINEKSFLEITIPIPSIEKQNRIVMKYNEKIDLAFRQEKEAEELKENIENFLVEELGIKKIEENNQKNDKGIRFINFKDLNSWEINNINYIINEIFDNSKYEVKMLKEICLIGSGGTPSRTRKDYYSGTIPWIKTGEVREKIITDTEEKITLEGLNNSSAKIYPKGSLIIAMYGATAGRTALLGIDSSTNQACAVLYEFNSKIINERFVWYYLENQINNIKKLASGSAQPNLNAQKIANYKIPLPPLEIQNKIIKIIEEKKEKIKWLKEQAEFNRKTAIEEFEKEIFQDEN